MYLRISATGLGGAVLSVMVSMGDFVSTIGSSLDFGCIPSRFIYRFSAFPAPRLLAITLWD